VRAVREAECSMRDMMECGHAANATTGNGEPACVICAGVHPGAEKVTAGPNLVGRLAKCGCRRTEPSSTDLAFFEYRGLGSERATIQCKCGYFECAHDPAYMARNVPSNRRTVVEQGLCTGFVARGPFEFDSYYCGCRGWD